MHKNLLAGTILATALVIPLTGCSSKPKTATLKPQEFYTPQHRVMPFPETRPVTSVASTTTNAAASAYAAPSDGTTNGASNGAAIATPTANNNGSPAQPDVSLGSYMLDGTVLGEDNGTPIYDDKVLAKLDQAMLTKATQTGTDKLTPDEYRRWVTGLIRDQVREEVNDELFYAAAQRSIGEGDLAIAAGATTVFRARQITNAGGSEAVARSRSLQLEGMTFEERVQQEYRRNVVRLYLAKRLYPQVFVPADDIREVYNRNLDQFSEKAAVRFRVIKIGERERGGRAQAQDRARSIHTRATKGGEDFAKLATQYNDDVELSKRRGYMSMQPMKDELGQPLKTATGEEALEGAWYQKGSMANEDLEKAIFVLEPGQVSDIIDQGAYFYVVKLEDKKTGKTRQFTDPEVQADITRTLENQQRNTLREKEIAKLRNASILKGAAMLTDDRYLQPAVEMAMQKYHHWNKASGPSSAAAR